MAKAATSVTTSGSGTALDKMGDLFRKAMPELADSFVTLDENLLLSPMPHIPTGSVIIDYLIGGKPNQNGVSPCPGLPKGKIISVYGASSCGKTTFALTVAAQVCRAGGTVLYIDWENEIVPQYCAALGVPIGDPSHFRLAQPETMEDGFKLMIVAARLGVDLIVVDSVGAGTPRAVAERTVEEIGNIPRIGLVAGAWSQIFPSLKTAVTKHGTTLIGISQVRKNINATGYGGEDITVQGGEAWKFYPALRIKLAKFQTEKTKVVNQITNKTEDQVIGNIVKIKLDKCKVSSSQGLEQLFYIRWGTGIDNVRSVFEIARAHGIIKQGGAWYTWTRPDGSTERFQGTEQVLKYFKDHEDQLELFTEQVRPRIGMAAAWQPLEGMEEVDELAQILADSGLEPVIPVDSTPTDDDLSL